MRRRLTERHDALPPRRSASLAIGQAGEIEQPLEKIAPISHRRASEHILASSGRASFSPSRSLAFGDRWGRVRDSARVVGRFLSLALVFSAALGCAASAPTPLQRATSLAREHREADAVKLLRDHLA